MKRTSSILFFKTRCVDYFFNRERERERSGKRVLDVTFVLLLCLKNYVCCLNGWVKKFVCVPSCLQQHMPGCFFIQSLLLFFFFEQRKFSPLKEALSFSKKKPTMSASALSADSLERHLQAPNLSDEIIPLGSALPSLSSQHQQQLQQQLSSSAGGGGATATPPPLSSSPVVSSPRKRSYSIALISDFFPPGFGGVEIHIYNLAQCLLRRGHKVIVMTRAYDDRNGVRYVTNGLKIYYMPFVGVPLPPGTSTLPSFWGCLPLMRDIFVREAIDIVHGHQTTSNLCHEGMFHGGMLGLRTCFTDHSLFGFSDAPSIHINKILQWSLSCVDECICVSNTSRENTVLRASIPPERVNVIANATDTSSFSPPERMKYRNWGAHINSEGVNGQVTIVAITRLVYRKGADLFVDVIPEVCKRHPRVDWIVGGDGPRLQQLQQMVDRHNLHHRVKLMGALKHSEVKDVLNQGQIFLNCSLTEAFCIAIIEAASCGLLSVSTNVGGVPEVLPSDMLLLAEPDPASIVERVEEAITQVPNVRPWDFHDNIKRFYSWDAVAERTERVYDRLMSRPILLPAKRLQRYFSVAPVYGMLCLLLAALDWLLIMLLDWLRPVSDIELAPTFPIEKFQQYEKQIHKIAESSRPT